MNNSNVKKRGRPKGEPTIKRSIALQEKLNDYLVMKHKETLIPYNSLINMAVAQMMESEKNSIE